MGQSSIANIIRFIIILLVQVLILKRVDLSFGNFDYIHILFYPAFILSLPVSLPRQLVIVLGFIMGIMVDIFYDSPGVHASALVAVAFARGLVLRALEPQGGYKTKNTPGIRDFDLGWFFIYSSILMAIHCGIYFFMEAFSFKHVFDIFLNTIFSFIFSMIFILLYQLLFRPGRN
jgi:hypothetical protein